MRPFWRSFWASIFAYIILSILIIVFINILIFSIGGSLSAKKPLSIKENSYLKMKLDFSIKERSGIVSNNDIFNPVIRNYSIKDVTNAIDKAKDDDKIKGIVLELENLSIGMTNLHVLRNKLTDFKSSGKFIISYGEYYSLGTYYLASVSDQVYLYPEGMIDFRGLSSEIMFFKNAIDKFGVDVQIIRGTGNTYKSAVEPYMYDKMSEENRTQIKSILTTLWNNLNDDIRNDRNISLEKINEIADSVYTYNAIGCLKHKLIDDMLYEDELDSIIKSKINLEQKSDISSVSFKKYLEKFGAKRELNTLSEKSNIAVIYAEGEIRSGKSEEGVMGSETIVKAINKAKNDTAIKAVVLRVNSPGGSSLASDVIWRALELTKKEKPVVVSMGGVAASGGYYISCGADRIFASTNTITGSIGVFGVIPTFGRMLNEKLGVTFDRVETNPHSAMSMFNPLDEFELNIYQKAVDEIYTTFINRVANGRHSLKVNDVHKIAKGRVWTAEKALDHELIDEIGTINDAISYAAKEVSLKESNIKILELPKKENDQFLEIISELDINAKSNNENELSKLLHKLNNQLESSSNSISSKDRYQTLMPFEFLIK